jgi:hypothetical protein
MDNEEHEIVRTGKGHGYLAAQLTEHLREMPNGGILVVGCPIARTGWMTYSVKELPQESAVELGVDVSDPNAKIDLYRPASEVFAPAFLASLNGCTITDGHPPGFVTPQNFNQYAQGHIQDPRKGTEPLEDGDWPIIADLLISAEPLVSKVRNRQVKEISLGYDYAIRRDGDKIVQCEMVGNHNAVVPKGRAGELVAIGDADPEVRIEKDGHITLLPHAAPPGPQASPPGPGSGHAASTINATQPKKEKHRMKNPLLHIWGRGLKAMAADSDTEPEDLAQAAMDLAAHAKDEPFEIEETGQVKDRKKTKDLDPEIEVTHTTDRAKRMHDRLDEILKTSDRHAQDADIAELRKLLDEYMGEEEAEPEHQEDEEVPEADPTELEETLSEDGLPEVVGESGEENMEDEDPEEEEEEAMDDEEGECAHCGTAHDEANCPECGCMDRKAKDKAKDRVSAADGATAALKMLRPVIAASDDMRVRMAFNKAQEVITRKSRPRASGNDGYKTVATAAARRSPKVAAQRAPANDAAAQNDRLQKYYDERLKGGK